MKITDLIHQGTLENVRAFNRHASAARAFEDTARRAAGPARTALALRATDEMRPAMLTQFHGLQRMVDQQSWIDRCMPKFGDLARVQGIGRGLSETAVQGIAASALGNQSAMPGFDMAADRINATLAAARPQTQALHKLIREPMGPALSSLLRRDLVPSLDVPPGVTIGPRSTLASVFPHVDFDAVVDSARDGMPVIADSPFVEPVVVSAQTVPIEVERGGWTVGNTISLVSLLLAASQHEGLSWLSQQLIDYLIELSRSLSS